MRFLPTLRCMVLATVLTGCASIPGLNNIPLWHGDPAKLKALGKGALVGDVDKALGRSRVLSTETVDVNGTPYQFRLYEWVEDIVQKRTVCSQACAGNVDYIKVPYVIVYVGSQPQLHTWGRLDQLGKNEDPAVAGMAGKLGTRYYELTRAR